MNVFAAHSKPHRFERINCTKTNRHSRRANVEDDESFNLALAIPGLDDAIQPSSSPQTRTPRLSSSQAGDTSRNAPSSEAGGIGRKKTLRSASATKQPPPKELLTSGTKNTYDMPESSKESIQPINVSEDSLRPGSGEIASQASVTSSNKRKRGQSKPEARSVPKPIQKPELQPPQSPATRQADQDEIEESPRDAPGSGRRRTIRAADATPTSARLQKLMNVNVEDAAQSSSPIANYVRRSEGLASARSKRSILSKPLHPGSDEADELENPETSPATNNRGGSEEVAEEISAVEAAKVIGRKRLRRSPRGSDERRESPELGTNPVEEPEQPEQEEVEEQDEQRTAKRRRGKASPAKQKLPVVKKKRAQAPSKAKGKPQRRKGRTSDAAPAEDEGRKAEHAIDITVQHFVNMNEAAKTDIPFANRQGDPSVIDVFAQVCEEVVEHTLGQLGAVAEAAQESGDRKACVIKMRAIEAYWGELSSRLLQHVSFLVV